MSLFAKHPDARVVHRIDWSGPLSDAPPLAASDWTVQPIAEGGVRVDEQSFDAGATAATLAGGTAGISYRVANRVVFADGTADARTLVVRVDAR